MKDVRLRGSYTVEAAFLMPMIIVILAWTLSLTIALYAQVDRYASEYDTVEDFDSAKRFRNLTDGSMLD